MICKYEFDIDIEPDRDTFESYWPFRKSACYEHLIHNDIEILHWRYSRILNRVKRRSRLMINVRFLKSFNSNRQMNQQKRLRNLAIFKNL